MTPYQTIYRKFLSKIEDLSLAQMVEEDRMMMLFEWLDSALGLITAERISMKHDLSQRDDTLRCFSADLESNEVEAISLYMVGAWYEDKISSLEHTSMFMGTTDEKWTNSKDHLKAISEIQENYFQRGRRLFRNYGYKANLIKKKG